MAETALTNLLAHEGLLRNAYLATKPLVLKKAVSTVGMPTIPDVLRLIQHSLLRRPYFALVQEGVKPPDSDVVASRRVAGAKVGGFIDPVRVRQHLDSGATLKLNQVEDWHAYIRSINHELNASFPSESKAYLFFTPAGKRGMLPHRDGSRVVAVQLEGAKEWHLYDAPENVSAEAGLDVDTSRELILLMEPGDLLYLPHGYAHAATAVGETSLHVTFTLTEPTPTDLVEAYLGAIAPVEPSLLQAEGKGAVAGAKLSAASSVGSVLSSAALIDRALARARTRDASR